MKISYILIILLMCGCYSSLSNKGKVKNPPSISIVQIPDFEDVDENRDGNLSKKEFEAISSSVESSNYSVKGPILVMSIIAGATLIMCAASSFLKCNRSE